MLTNSEFELTPEQLQLYSDWLSKPTVLPIDPDDYGCIVGVEVVFTFTNIGRGVIARSWDSGAELVVEALLK